MDFEEIKAVKDDLGDHLMDGFWRHRNVNGIGLSKDDLGWYIKVCLVKPHRWWHRKPPSEYRGARVHTQVIGEVRAF